VNWYDWNEDKKGSSYKSRLQFDMESFRLKTTDSAISAFYSWVFGFADKVQNLCLKESKKNINI